MTDVKWWDFTCPEDKAGTDDGIMTLLDELCERWAYGHEVGADGYRHIQGRVVFKKAKELATVRNQTEVVLPTAHWTKTSVRNFDYVEKEGNFVRSWEKVLRKYACLELNLWEQQLLQDLADQNDRQITVVIDEKGGRGKSTFSRYLEATHQMDVCPVTDGDACNYIEYCQKHPFKGYVFDIPRSDTIKTKKAMWRAIEQVKNGCLYDRRYTSTKTWIDPPKILIFANEEPPLEALTGDRWRVYYFNDTWGKDTLTTWAPEEADE